MESINDSINKSNAEDSFLSCHSTSPPAKKGRKSQILRKRESTTVNLIRACQEKQMSTSLQDLLKKNSQLEKQCKELSEKYDILTTALNSLISKIDKLSTTSDSNSISYSNIVARKPFICKNLRSSNSNFVNTQSNKNSNFPIYGIIENLPDTKLDNQINHDAKLIKDICSIARLPIPLNWYRINCKNSNIYSRPVKIQFRNEANRLSFIRKFRNTITQISDRPCGERTIRCRRDMTSKELTTLRENRKRAFELNKEAKLLKFYVKDIKIVESSNPKPLPQNNQL